MRGVPLTMRRRACGAGRDRGQVSILILGLLGVILLLVIGGVDVTAAQIARARLLDASDSAALEAANALDEVAAYSGGIGDSVVVSNGTVEQAVEDNLAARPMQKRICCKACWISAMSLNVSKCPSKNCPSARPSRSKGNVRQPRCKAPFIIMSCPDSRLNRFLLLAYQK